MASDNPQSDTAQSVDSPASDSTDTQQTPEQTKAKAAPKRPHVVVLGGGMGGLSAVKTLKRADVDVTLIDRHIYSTFQPLLYQVATATLNPGDITYFLRATRAKQKNVRFLAGTVRSIDHNQKLIHLKENVSVEYDYLIIACGVTANFFGVPGAAEYSIPLYKRKQALEIRNQLFAKFEDYVVNGQDRDLRVVMVGGGPTGVEVAGALAEMRNYDMPVTYPMLDTKRIHVTIVEMGDHLLSPFEPKLRDYTLAQLEKRDVDVRLNTAVKEVYENGVTIEKDGKESFLESELVVWSSGITVHPTVKDWGVPQGKGGRIVIDDHCRVPGVPDVFAAGDIATNPDSPLPQLGQPAIQEGRYAAKYIKRKVKGKPEPKPFKYFDKGTMATIGRNAAIAQVNHLPSLRGFIAWAMWAAVHVAFLVTNQNRFSTMVNLSNKYLFRRNRNAIVGDTPYGYSQQAVIIGSENVVTPVDQAGDHRDDDGNEIPAEYHQQQPPNSD
ncbi:MAG: NAD(P)/FAD-dependent oxidoreductase [Candidatus Nanopelagicales bacterium]